MRRMLRGDVASLALVGTLAIGRTVLADCTPATRYVSPTGTDTSNECASNSAPCATVGHAVAVACAGDTVAVTAGTYAERVVIGTSLTLVGDGAGSSTIQAPSNLPSGGSVVTIQGTDVSVELSGFTVAGPGPSGCGSINAGILVRDHATANIHDNTVSDIRDEPTSGCQNGRAIRIGESGSPATATVTHNTVVGYQKNGIDIRDASTTATIRYNAVTGAGPTPLIAQNGVVVVSATATIQGNTIAGNDCDHASCGPDPINDTQSTGVLLLYAQEGSSVSGNMIGTNDIGVYNNAVGPTTISGNQVIDNRYIGVFLDQGAATVSTNVISGSAVGVLDVSFGGNDGDSAGTVSANWIEGNDIGIAVIDQDTGDAFVPTVTTHGNSIVGNGVGFTNDTVASQTATENWWGCSAGPGATGCDTTTGTVDVTSPLTAPPAILVETAQIVPAVISMLVGESLPISISDTATGTAVPTIPIVSSDPTVAYVDIENAELRAVAAGEVTLHAGPLSATVTVHSGALPAGTIRWIAPSDGSGLIKQIPAVPSGQTGAVADLFTLEASGRVQAVTADGSLSWVTQAPIGVTDLVPDMGGGALAITPTSITRLDPVSGADLWTYNSGDAALSPTIALYPDGTIAFVETDLYASTPHTDVVGLHPTTGAEAFRVQLQNGESSSSPSCEAPGYDVASPPVAVSSLVVTAAGTGYLTYVSRSSTTTYDSMCGFESVDTEALLIVTLSSDGSAATETLHSWSSSRTAVWNGLAYEFDSDPPIPDVTIRDTSAPAEDGISTIWVTSVPEWFAHCDEIGCSPLVPPEVTEYLTTTSSLTLATEAALPSSYDLRTPVVVGDDSTYFAGFTKTDTWTFVLAAFDASGDILWEVPGDFAPVAATAGGGLVAQESGTDALVTFDADGSPSYQTVGTGAQYAWGLGACYAVRSLDDLGTIVASVVTDLVEIPGRWGMVGGSPSHHYAAALQVASQERCLAACAGGQLAADAFCRTIRSKTIRGACWAAVAAGEVACAGFCYNYF